MNWLTVSSFLAMGACAAYACGGIAIIDASSGAGGATSNGNGGGGGVPTSSSIGAGGGTYWCDEACAAVDGCLNKSNIECVQGCKKSTTGCTEPHQAWLQCIVASGVSAPDCSNPTACQTQLEAYLQCTGIVQGTDVQCSEGTDDCSCDAQLANDAVLQSVCVVNQGTYCACFSNNKQFGNCYNEEDFACDVFFGCCGMQIFITGP